MLKFTQEIKPQVNQAPENCGNRDWSTTEESDICCYTAPNIDIEIWEDYAVISRNTGSIEEQNEFAVFITTPADNVYVAASKADSRIYITNSLVDCLDTASLISLDRYQR